MHMLGIYNIYTSSRFNSYFIKLVTLGLHNYSFLEKIIRSVIDALSTMLQLLREELEEAS